MFTDNTLWKEKSLPSGHQMVEVNHLEERLDAGALLDLLLVHALLNPQRIPGNSRYDAVAVLASVNAILEGLDNNSLLAGVAPVEHDHHLTRLEELNLQ
jgi:hypothetical protein